MGTDAQTYSYLWAYWNVVHVLAQFFDEIIVNQLPVVPARGKFQTITDYEVRSWKLSHTYELLIWFP
jgi:hypothetical protein